MLLAGSDGLLVGGGDLRVREIAGDAHLGGEVVGADEDDVDARHGGDRIDIGDRLRCLDHDDSERRRVERRRKLADLHRLVIELRLRAGD